MAGETFGTEDPRTGEIYTQVAEAQEADVDAAVKAARMVSSPPTHQHPVLFTCLTVHDVRVHLMLVLLAICMPCIVKSHWGLSFLLICTLAPS